MSTMTLDEWISKFDNEEVDKLSQMEQLELRDMLIQLLWYKTGGNVHYEESKSPQTHDKQYYEKIIKDAYGSKKWLETVEEGIQFTDTLRALFGIKPCNKKEINNNGKVF